MSRSEHPKQHVITFQENSLGRDYIYEMSVAYLISRSIHVAYKLGLARKITKIGMTIENLINEFPQYSGKAVRALCELLICYSIFQQENGIIYANALSESLEKIGAEIYINKKEWNAVYDICTYLSDTTGYKKLLTNKIKISINKNTLSLETNNSDALIRELASLHLVSRAIRYAAELNLFDALSTRKIKKGDQIGDWINTFAAQKISKANYKGFLKLLDILIRYKILTASYHLNPLSIYLTTSHVHTIFPAMLMIDFSWWGSVGMMRKGLETKSLSAFQEFNKKTFYDVYNDEKSPFPKGIASISLLEDEIVAKSLLMALEKYSTFVDIGGGEGGLLGNLFKLFGSSKKYILFEKQLPDINTQAAKISHLQQAAKEKFGPEFDLQIIFGDFNKTENNIPIIDNCAYIIKCVLHNIPTKDQIVAILKNVAKKMGKNSQLFLSERTLPAAYYKPHYNRLSNLLMWILFKADSYSLEFYTACLQVAGFKISLDKLDAGNYCIIGSKVGYYQDRFVISMNRTKSNMTPKTHDESHSATQNYQLVSRL